MHSLWTAVFALIVILFPDAVPAVESGSGATPAVRLMLSVEKGDTFTYNVRAEFTREMQRTGIEEPPFRTEHDLLDVQFTETCMIVEKDGTMGFEVSYGQYKLVRTVTTGDRVRKEVYDNDGITLHEDGKLLLSRKWLDMPRSEQAETRKVFARGYAFAASGRGELKELFEGPVLDHELPGFHALRAQQEAYYPNFPIEEGTIWSWRSPMVIPAGSTHSLSGRSVPTARKYEFLELRKLDGVLCATISAEETSQYDDPESKTAFSRKLVKKSHVERSSGMAWLTEGTIESELATGETGKGIRTKTRGSFTIGRSKAEAE